MRSSNDIASKRVIVTVSDSMANLRKTQETLNGFWQTSELAYGYILSHSNTVFPDPQAPAVEVLGHLESLVWHPTSKGRIKREGTIGATLEQVRENAGHIFRTTLVSYYSAFEAYLNARLTFIKRHGRWGPFVESLHVRELTEPTAPVRLRTILCADYCRLIRNKFIHDAFSFPTSLDAAILTKWRAKLTESALSAGWPSDLLEREIKYAVNRVVGGAVYAQNKTRKQGKETPIEYFYMLFTFANLHHLAFEIEEALQPFEHRAGSRVSVLEEIVRRRDLIDEHAARS